MDARRAAWCDVWLVGSSPYLGAGLIKRRFFLRCWFRFLLLPRTAQQQPTPRRRIVAKEAAHAPARAWLVFSHAEQLDR
ncbi:hypothetical protein F4809DRAFT_602244 [Biscogniauxia mediterranea]|nr:hypothetical protein F4809DRAFT_602244 [Biscogniauxia mediterranea]